MKLAGKAGLVNTLARPIGVEIEISHLRGVPDACYQKGIAGRWEHDATITRGGQEFVMQAKSGDDWVKEMFKLLMIFGEYKPKADESCGLHVHVQASDLGWWQIRRLVAIWCRIEKSLYGTLVNKERLHNHYCIPFCSESPSCPWQFTKRDLIKFMRTRNRGFMKNASSWIKNSLIAKLYDIKLDGNWKVDREEYREALARFNSIKRNKRTPGQAEGQGCRYGALNLHALFFQGTVEMRLKEGTVDPEELIFWPLTAAWIVESAQRFSDKEALALHDVKEWAALAAEKGMQKGVVDWVMKKCNQIA